MTENEKEKCHTIIHATSVATGGVGAGRTYVPRSGNAVIASIQLII